MSFIASVVLGFVSLSSPHNVTTSDTIETGNTTATSITVFISHLSNHIGI